MAYVFGRTGGDAQTHLRLRHTEDSADPFKVQNARLGYKSLNMKITETFSAFQTCFLHLARQA